MADASERNRIGRQNLFVLEWFRAQRSLPAWQQELRDLRNQLTCVEAQLGHAIRQADKKAEAAGVPVKIESDQDGGQLYIRVKEMAPEEIICCSRKVGEHVVLDSDENGELIGIHLIGMAGISERKTGILTDRTSAWFVEHPADGDIT